MQKMHLPRQYSAHRQEDGFPILGQKGEEQFHSNQGSPWVRERDGHDPMDAAGELHAHRNRIGGAIRPEPDVGNLIGPTELAGNPQWAQGWWRLLQAALEQRDRYK